MTRRPEHGSPWARHCPDAWPREWLDTTGELPPGFARAAESHEADLITGRISESAFLQGAGRIVPDSSGRERARFTPRPRQKKPNAVVRKLLGYRVFFAALPDLDPELSAGAVAVWCWLWTCERKGHARYTVRKLGERFGVSKSTAARWLSELVGAGFMCVVRRGRPGRSCSVVRIRCRVGEGTKRLQKAHVIPAQSHPRDRVGAPAGQEHSSTK